MTEKLNAETFDLMSVLSGQDFPTVEVPVYFNEATGLKIYHVQNKLNAAVDEKEVKKLDKELKSLISQAKGEQYVVTVQAIPDQMRRDLLNKVLDEFPSKKDVFGREEAHPEADSQFSRLMWSAHIRKVTSPTGAIAVLDEESARALHDSSSTTVHEAINRGITELQTGAKAGFEIAAKDIDFL